MKLNIAYPASGAQKIVEIDDELKLKPFYEKRMAQEVTLDHLGDEFKGYIARISGGNDKQGFPMKQGVLTHDRVRLLLKKGQSCYRPRRAGGRFRKSVRGCVVDGNLAVLNLVIVKKGEGDLPGITDKTVPRRLGPKRANNIRKFFNLSKDDDVRQYVVRRPLKEKEGKPARTKAPKIQRLITPERLQRKRREKRLKILRSEKSKREEATFLKLMAQRNKEERAAKEEARRRRSSASHGGSRTSTSSVESEPVKVVKKGAAKKGVPAKKDDKKKAVSGKDAKKAAPAVASKDSKKKAQSKSAAAAPAKAPAKPAKKVEVKGKKSKGGKK